jgi:hypothetical protein
MEKSLRKISKQKKLLQNYYKSKKNRMRKMLKNKEKLTKKALTLRKKGAKIK